MDNYFSIRGNIGVSFKFLLLNGVKIYHFVKISLIILKKMFLNSRQF